MKLCMGCMSEIEDRFTVCPYCGFNEAALQQESYYLTPGTVVGGKYIVGKVLRYGGHTVSYLGMDAEANRKVLVKEYLPSDFATRSEGEPEITIYSGDAKTQFEQGLTSFLNEANKLQSLGTIEGIARVYDCVSENDTGYVIAEYVEGRTLKEILATGKRYGVKEAVTLLSPILQALERVHAMHIIHCDISPETIMVADTGEVKLVDFGATRYVTTANSKSLAIILKQGYAPEEQYRSSGNRGSWTDVYAVAAVMYRMITGRTPQESVERALVDELKEPSKLGVSIPANVENALMNALNVYHKERTVTAGAFLQELNSSSVKRIKTAKKKKEIGKFPIWAKGLVAALLCIAVVGGFAVYKGMDSGRDSYGSVQYVDDFTNKRYDDAKEWYSENKDELPANFAVKKGYMYSNEIEEGKIIDQSIDPGKELPLDEKELIVYVASKEKTSCQDIVDSQMNVALLQKKLGLAENQLTPVDSEEDNNFKICQIKLKNEVENSKGEKIGGLSSENIEDNSLISIEISNIEEIEYYAGKFFCWGDENQEACLDLKNYAERNDEGKPIYKIENIQAPMYKKKVGQEGKYDYEGLGNLKDSGLVDDSYYTYHGNWEVGHICHQTYDEQKLDLGKTEDMAKLPDGKLFYVIGTSIFLDKEESLSEFQKRLKKKYTFQSVVYWKDGKEYDDLPDGVVADEANMKVVDENGDKVEYFKKEEMEHLTYRIAVMKDLESSEQKAGSTNSTPSKPESDDPEL